MPAVTSPPRAARQPYEHSEHGVRRPDPYHWMRGADSLTDHETRVGVLRDSVISTVIPPAAVRWTINP